MKRFSVPALVLLVLLAGCSKRSANDYFSAAEREYKQARQAADTLRDREQAARLFEPALENYLKVVQEFPNDPLAEHALFKIATIRNNEMRDPAQAVGYFTQYADRYPDTKEAPTATFLVAYLYHNDLHQLDSAGVWYKRFLDRFPDNQMASSAQFELNSLGKSPDQLIPSDSITVGSKPGKTNARQHPM